MAKATIFFLGSVWFIFIGFIGFILIGLIGFPYQAQLYKPHPAVRGECYQQPLRCPSPPYNGIDTPFGVLRMYLTPVSWRSDRNSYHLHVSLGNLIAKRNVAPDTPYEERLKDPDKFTYLLIDKIEIISNLPNRSYKISPFEKEFPVRLDVLNHGMTFHPPLALDHEAGEEVTIHVHVRFKSKETGELFSHIIKTKWVPYKEIRLFGGLASL